jgi:hypothetical protein
MSDIFFKRLPASRSPMTKRRGHAGRDESRSRARSAVRLIRSPMKMIVNADDEFLCSETKALWKLIREARELKLQVAR